MADQPFAGTVFASAARIATPTTGVVNNTQGYKGVRAIINVSALAATPSVVPKISGISASGVLYDLLVGAAITATGKTILLVYPGVAAVANLVADSLIGPRLAFDMTHGNADSITYTVDFELLP